ncbi:solute carrier family 2, facilitated glucose transporter member 8-like [Lineus longissimus]|uniref:solute carrier family 2, facilitated glucose transporter member 8-like n=1 Tax=Lineus longissimus TaxID=88925 RepID=UPI00315D73FA
MKKVVFATFVACTAPFSFGYAIGYTSPAIPEMEWKGVMSANNLSWFSSLLTLGGMMGSLLAGVAMELIGRKRTLMITTLPLVLGWTLIAVGFNTFTFLLGRILTGIAIGLVSAATPVYIAEISSKEHRGLLGCCNQLSITFGILMVYYLGITGSWQFLAWAGVVVPLLSNCMMATIPETPRWLLMKGRRAEAKQSVLWLRGPYIDAENELRDIEENMESGEKASLSDFTKPELYEPLKVAVCVMALQQLTGINAIMFYAVTILQQAGLFTMFGNTGAVVIGGIQVVATLLSCFMMDRAGRRRLLLFAASGMMMSCIVFGWYYNGMATRNVNTTKMMEILPVICLMVYIISFSFGWGPVPMLLSSEIFPQKARGLASSISVLVNWGFAFLVTKTFSPLSGLIGYHGIFWLFAAFCFVGILFVYKFVPETKGKSLEDIELYFLGKSLHTSNSRERQV